MFIDEVVIDLYAGDGGNGCMAFHREKFIEFGGPDGGNGGSGADIVFKVDEGLNTLIDLRMQKHIKAPKGENGMGKGMHGKSRAAVVVKVPLGTVITDLDTGLIIADLNKKDSEVIAARGGRGGRGNIALATRSLPCPSYCENGEPGEYKKVKIELKSYTLMDTLSGNKILVNTTPVGMKNFLEGVSPVDFQAIKTLDDDAFIYDIVYNPIKTRLIKYAQECNKRYTGGLDMLVFQAQKAFEIWTGQTPDTKAMKIAALESLAQ